MPNTTSEVRNMNINKRQPRRRGSKCEMPLLFYCWKRGARGIYRYVHKMRVYRGWYRLWRVGIYPLPVWACYLSSAAHSLCILLYSDTWNSERRPFNFIWKMIYLVLRWLLSHHKSRIRLLLRRATWQHLTDVYGTLNWFKVKKMMSPKLYMPIGWHNFIMIITS